MCIKDSIIKVLSPFLSFLFRCVLKRVRPLFLQEDDRLKKVLSELSFHPALCVHPSILFFIGVGVVKSHSPHCMRESLFIIKKFVKLGLLKGERGALIVKELGIQPCFADGTRFWFIECHSPFVLYPIPNAPKQDGKTVVYTALTGNYDDVHELLYREADVDYLLFTNNPSLKSRTWTVIYVESDLDDKLLSREIKLLPQKYLGEEYKISVYVDASAVVYGELSELTRYLGNGVSFAVSRHSVRKSVREEIDACVRLRGTDGTMAEMQYERYLQEGFVDDKPLLECGLLVRAHHDGKLQELMQLWFDEFKMGVRRDQLSLLPCMSKLRFENYIVMDGSVWHNQFIRILRHKQN